MWLIVTGFPKLHSQTLEAASTAPPALATTMSSLFAAVLIVV